MKIIKGNEQTFQCLVLYLNVIHNIWYSRIIWYLCCVFLLLKKQKKKKIENTRRRKLPWQWSKWNCFLLFISVFLHAATVFWCEHSFLFTTFLSDFTRSDVFEKENMVFTLALLIRNSKLLSLATFFIQIKKKRSSAFLHSTDETETVAPNLCARPSVWLCQNQRHTLLISYQ